jgi:hypothetical protein
MTNVQAINSRPRTDDARLNTEETRRIDHRKTTPERRTLLLAICLMLASSQAVLSQATTGSIAGRILDPSGTVASNVSLRARNDATGLTQLTRSNTSGEYSLAGLPPGEYTLEVHAEGFTTINRSGLDLTIDQKMRLDFELTLATFTQSDTVTAGTPLLQVQSVETGELIRSREIVDLPLLGRNFLDLTRLTAGVSSGGGGNTLNISVNGQREFVNSILVDGVEVAANRNNDTTVRPSVDSIEEFKVVASGYAAEFGRASGGVVAIQSKSGTNRFHGGLYEFFRPSPTAARSFFETGASPLKQHNFGDTLGGPVRKDSTFFFVSYEGVRLRNAFSFLDSVPPAGQIRFLSNGGVDLSGLKDPLTGKPIPIFDPGIYAANYYAAPFPGDIIPANRVSPAGRAVLQNFFPAPTVPGILNGWFGNFNSRQAYTYSSDTAGGRMDHIFSERDRLSAVYHYGTFQSVTGDRFAGHIPVAGAGDADYGDRENSRSQTLAISEIHLIASRWLNESRFGYTEYRLDQLSLLDNQNLASEFGMGNINLPGFSQTSGLPDVFLGFGAQTGGSTYKPLHFLDRNYQVSNTLTTRLGAHEVKAGAQYRRLSSAPFFSLFPTGFQFYGGPGLSLTGDPTYGFYDPGAFYYNGGSDIADLLLGLPYSVNLGQQLTNPTTRSWEGSFYVQDTWRVTPRLALSYGLRYEYFAPWTETRNRASNFDLMTGRMLLAGRGGNSSSLVAPDGNSFAPRLGLAYRVGSRTAIRAGWGVFYSPENDAREDVLTKNYPFAVQQTIFNDIFGGLPFPYVLDSGTPRITSVVVPPGASSMDPPGIQAATGAAQNVFLVDSHLRTGYSQLFNFSLQQAIASDLTLEAGYVGSVSRKLSYAVGNLNVGNKLAPDLGQIQGLFSEGSADFHSLQVKANKRFSRRLSFLAAYTLGKNMDNGPAPFNLGHNLNSQNQPQDPFNLALERAPADSDVKHNLVASYIYELPFGKGQPLLASLRGWPQALFGGWQVNGIFAARSGLPVNVVRNPHNTGFEGLRPDVVRDPNLAEWQRSLTRYFDTGAFLESAFTGSHKHDLGNAGRNLVRGPGLANLDFSVFKEIPLEERARLQLRFEFFNLTNTPHFANPDGNMSDGSFGSITQTIANPRIIQFAAKLGW